MAAETLVEERIVRDPRILGGKPVIRGTRISVAFILECLAEMSVEDLLHDYPDLTRDDVRAAVLYAARAAR